MATSKRSAPLTLSQSVWFFLIEVRITGDTKQPWVSGSLALVQAFVPGRRLEDCLARLDAFLPSEELERIDTLKAERYDPTPEPPDLPGDYFRVPLEQAAETNDCALGVFIVAKTSAREHPTQ